MDDGILVGKTVVIVEQRLVEARPEGAQNNTAKGSRPARVLFIPNRQLKLRAQVREVMRYFHF